jgi:hypothetical protein
MNIDALTREIGAAPSAELVKLGDREDELWRNKLRAEQEAQRVADVWLAARRQYSERFEVEEAAAKRSRIRDEILAELGGKGVEVKP